MKVAFHVDQLWFRAPGGIGTYVKEMLDALPASDASLELTRFRSNWRGRPSSDFTERGQYPGVELPWSIRALYPAWDWFGRPRLPASLADHDVIHATNHAAVPPVRRGQHLVVTVHDLAFERYPGLFPRRWLALYRRGLRAAIERADAILVPSVSVRDDLVGRPGVDPDRVRVTPLGVRRQDRTAEMMENDREGLADHGITPPYVLAVGTIEARKNLVRLIRAYRRLGGQGMPQSLVLIGDDGWGAEQVRAELDAGGPGRVVRAGGFSSSTLATAYADADVVAYVSLYEGFGLPVVEAMSAGAPVVTSNTSSLPEVAGGAALLVDPEDVDAIAGALERVLTDPTLADDLRRRGRERAASYTWAATAHATLDVYRRLTGAPAP